MRESTTTTTTDEDTCGLIKSKEEFRNYVDSDRQSVVEDHYRNMRTFQTVEFVNEMHRIYSFKHGGRAKMTIRDAFKLLKSYIDSSDPDMTLPNIIHMLQTAEGIRRDGHPEWMQLVGLIHDMGKIMFLVSTGHENHSLSKFKIFILFSGVQRKMDRLVLLMVPNGLLAVIHGESKVLIAH